MSDGPVRAFLRRSAAMAVLYVGANTLGFLSGVILARSLGASHYGVYALAMTSATFAGLVTEFGLPVLVMRETGRARASGDWALVAGLMRWADRAVLALSAAIALGFVAWYAVAAARVGSAYLAAMLWGVALIPLAAVGKLRALALLALDRVWAGQAPVLILRPLLFVFGCVALWRATGRLDPTSAMAVQVASAGATTLAAALLFRRFRPPAWGAARPAFAARDWIASAVPMGLSEGLRLVQGQLGLLLVGAFAGTAAAGVYRVGEAVTQLPSMIVSIVNIAAVPAFARLHKAGDLDGIARIAVLGALAISIGPLMLALPIVLLGDWLFPQLFGREFAASVPIFATLSLGMVLAGGAGLVLSITNMVGEQLLSTQSLMLVVATNALLALVLVPRFGALGGAAAGAAAFAIGSYACAWRLRRRTGINATLFNPRLLELIGARRARPAPLARPDLPG